VKKKIDRRILRTRSLLFNALIKLLNERSFKDISIKDLTDEADIARPTFYRNYTAVQDILLTELDDRAHGFIVEIKELVDGCGSFQCITETLFKRWDDNAELFQAMYKAEMDNFIIDRFIDFAMEMIKIINNDTLPPLYKPKLYYFAGGAHNLFKTWLLQGRQETVEEMAAVLAKDLFLLVENSNEMNRCVERRVVNSSFAMQPLMA